MLLTGLYVRLELSYTRIYQLIFIIFLWKYIRFILFD